MTSSARATKVRSHVLYKYIYIYIYTYIYLRFPLFRPVSVSLASLARPLVMCSVSTNGERASLVNLKLTIGSLLECC